MAAMSHDRETASSVSDVEALYYELFGTSAIDAGEENTKEWDELDAYAAVYEVAKEHPSMVRKAARDGTAAHYRGACPFDYAVGETRRCGEVAP